MLRGRIPTVDEFLPTVPVDEVETEIAAITT